MKQTIGKGSGRKNAVVELWISAFELADLLHYSIVEWNQPARQFIDYLQYIISLHNLKLLANEGYPEKSAVCLLTHLVLDLTLQCFVVLYRRELGDLIVNVYTNSVRHMLCV